MTPEELVAWRKKLGLTQQAMAERFGISRVTLNRAENGKSPTPAALERGATSAETKRFVTHTTHPELYVKMGKHGWGFMAVHPRNLLGKYMVENEYGEAMDSPWPESILKEPRYIEARAAANAKLKANEERMRRTPADELFPDAAPGENLYDYNIRKRI